MVPASVIMHFSTAQWDVAPQLEQMDAIPMIRVTLQIRWFEIKYAIVEGRYAHNHDALRTKINALPRQTGIFKCFWQERKMLMTHKEFVHIEHNGK
jgi:hypothetical protein